MHGSIWFYTVSLCILVVAVLLLLLEMLLLLFFFCSSFHFVHCAVYFCIIPFSSICHLFFTSSPYSTRPFHFPIHFAPFRYKCSNNWNKNIISSYNSNQYWIKRSRVGNTQVVERMHVRKKENMSKEKYETVLLCCVLSAMCAFACITLYALDWKCTAYKCIHTTVVIFNDHC